MSARVQSDLLRVKKVHGTEGRSCLKADQGLSDDCKAYVLNIKPKPEILCKLLQSQKFLKVYTKLKKIHGNGFGYDEFSE